MASKKATPLPPDPILGSAVSVWQYLTTRAGLDSLFYDKEILFGNGAEKGLYANLGITPQGSGFEEDLLHYKIPVEKLVVAFFKTLQPFAQMMNDICVFFENHRVKETNKAISICFNFDAVSGEALDFNLEHFRQTINQFGKVKQLVNYYHLNPKQLRALLNLFGNNYSVTTKNISARYWIDAYRVTDYDSQHKAVFSTPDIEIPVTGNASLNEQINRAMAIWKSYVNSCRKVAINRNEFAEKMRDVSSDIDNSLIDEITAPWSAIDLRHTEPDFWPSFFLEKLFYKLEEIEALPNDKKSDEEEALAITIQDFFKQLPQAQIEEEQLLQELIDLLKLPVWNRRSELYAVWILTLIDEITSSYPRKIHHQNGMLSLSFAATHIATIETRNGDIQLWSEVRSLVKGTDIAPLKGKSRENQIQPDYALYKNNSISPLDCILAIEVKQYKEHSNTNFSAALNDYTRGLPAAHVFLANYGSVSSKMKLTEKNRSHFFGQIMPDNPNILSFKNRISNYLPAPPQLTIIPGFENISPPLPVIDSLYVDVSGSLNEDAYKEFLQTYISTLIHNRKVKQLFAVDDSVRQRWDRPDIKSIKELISLNFNNGTDFVQFIISSESSVVITDTDGLKLLEQSGLSCYVVVYSTKEVQEIRFVDNKATP